MLKIGHNVVRPGKAFGDAPITIPVAEELETVPGIPTNDREVDWYAREYPLESHTFSERASGDWYSSIQDAHPGMRKLRDEHYALDPDLVAAGGTVSDDLLAEFKQELGDALRRQSADIELVGDQAVS